MLQRHCVPCHYKDHPNFKDKALREQGCDTLDCDVSVLKCLTTCLASPGEDNYAGATAWKVERETRERESRKKFADVGEKWAKLCGGEREGD